MRDPENRRRVVGAIKNAPRKTAKNSQNTEIDIYVSNKSIDFYHYYKGHKTKSQRVKNIENKNF